MTEIRRSRPNDLAIVASWIHSAAECRLWSGSSVGYPINMGTLADELRYDESEAWTMTIAHRVVAFGQLVPRPAGRLHLARLITAPHRRGEGLGRAIAAHLLGAAQECQPSAVSLNVSPENGPALALYRSLGFALTARPPEDPRSTSVYMELVT